MSQSKIAAIASFPLVVFSVLVLSVLTLSKYLWLATPPIFGAVILIAVVLAGVPLAILCWQLLRAHPLSMLVVPQLIAAEQLNFSATDAEATLSDALDTCTLQIDAGELALANFGDHWLPRVFGARNNALQSLIPAYLRRYRWMGDPADLSAALAHARAGLAQAAARPASRTVFQILYSHACRDAWWRTGDVQALDEAIEMRKRAAITFPGLLAERYEHWLALDELYHARTQSVPTAPDNITLSCFSDAAFNVLDQSDPAGDEVARAIGSSRRALLTRKRDHLDAAIHALSNALQAAERDMAHWVETVLCYARCRLARFEQTRDATELVLALAHLAPALKAASVHAPTLPGLLHMRGSLYFAQWQLNNESRILSRAIESLEQALNLLPPACPDRAAYGAQLAQARNAARTIAVPQAYFANITSTF